MRVNVHPWSISLLMDLYIAAEVSTEWDNLWFPLSIIASKSNFFIPL